MNWKLATSIHDHDTLSILFDKIQAVSTTKIRLSISRWTCIWNDPHLLLLLTTSEWHNFELDRWTLWKQTLSLKTFTKTPMIAAASASPAKYFMTCLLETDAITTPSKSHRSFSYLQTKGPKSASEPNTDLWQYFQEEYSRSWKKLWNLLQTSCSQTAIATGVRLET